MIGERGHRLGKTVRIESFTSQEKPETTAKEKKMKLMSTRPSNSTYKTIDKQMGKANCEPSRSRYVTLMAVD